LLVHGLGCSSEAWWPALRCLQRQRLEQPVFAPDMPGYGCSPGPREALGIDELADWNARLLDALEVERAHVAANSMGCQVSLALARRHPERVGGVVLVGPPPGGHGMTVGQYLWGLLLDGCHETMSYNVTLLRMYRQMGIRRYLATVQEMLADDPVAAALAVTAPVHILRGERDAIASERAARELAERLPRGSFETIPGAAHAVQFTHPKAFTRAVLAFIGRVEQEEALSAPPFTPREGR
jgi:pimeloyl-ACP methyl ester carboxylesterase